MQDRLDALITVRDWLRHAVSRFEAARLVYGHGTASAVDEAAFLILTALHLPIDQLDPWLDSRLLRHEREEIARLVDARVESRKPAPYLVKAAWIGPHRFYVDERVIVPRSYIGELLVTDGLAAVVPHDRPAQRVLDLCTGGGSLAIIAALTFPDAAVDAVDVSAEALDVARRNVAEHGLAQRINLVRSDLFESLDRRSYDLIIANPPYVTEAAVAAFPPEFRAEPEVAHAGGADGLGVIRRILAGARSYLDPEGVLVIEVGQSQAALDAEFPQLPFLWIDTADSEGEVLAIRAAELSAIGHDGAIGRGRRRVKR